MSPEGVVYGCDPLVCGWRQLWWWKWSDGQRLDTCPLVLVTLKLPVLCYFWYLPVSTHKQYQFSSWCISQIRSTVFLQSISGTLNTWQSEYTDMKWSGLSVRQSGSLHLPPSSSNMINCISSECPSVFLVLCYFWYLAVWTERQSGWHAAHPPIRLLIFLTFSEKYNILVELSRWFPKVDWLYLPMYKIVFQFKLCAL